MIFKWMKSALFFIGPVLLSGLSPQPGLAADEVPIFDVPALYDIAVDGKADDWGARGLRLEILTPLNAALRPAADFDAKARLGWNDTGLLVLVQVNDDETVEAKNEDSLWDRDSLELFLAPQRGADDAYQITISPGLDAEHADLRWHFHDLRQNPDLKQMHAPIMAARTKTDNGYILEALLPWENLAIKPAPGREVALQMILNDWDSGSPRYQMMWHPAAGTASAPKKMQRLRLAAQPGPAVQAVATGRYERFRRTRIDVTATGELTGKTVEVRDGKRRLGKANLLPDAAQEYGGKARLKMLLPMPPQGQAYGPLTVFVDGRAITTLNLGDLNEARRQAFERAPLGFSSFVFNNTIFPSPDFKEPSYVEDIVGSYTLKTTYYDANYDVVKSAAKPGRYGAVVDIATEDGKHHKRFFTLFRQPEDINWRRTEMPFSVVFPPQLGVDPVVTEEQKRTVGEAFKGLWVDSTRNSPEAAILLAGLYETRPGDEAVARTDVWRRDLTWWYGLKQKIGELRPLRYLLSLPQGYEADTTKRWPLMLFLHGSGERGDDLSKVKVHGPPKLVAEGRQFPFIIVSPQCPNGQWWFPQQLGELLDSISAQYRVDADRIYVTGLSMGGRGTWDLAMEYPDRFAAIAPIAGWGDEYDVERVTHLPVWAFHGDKDAAVPMELGQRTVEALKKAGGDVQFTIYPNVEHDSWTATYENQDLYDWFLQHRRGAPAE